MFERFKNRKYRRAYREELARWNADGGDSQFRFDYELTPESVVLDVGGYEGQWATDLYARQRCRIHIFEPVPAFADAIRERFSGNGDVSVHTYAIGSGSRKENLSQWMRSRIRCSCGGRIADEKSNPPMSLIAKASFPAPSRYWSK